MLACLYMFVCPSVFVQKQAHLYKMANLVGQKHLDMMIFHLFLFPLLLLPLRYTLKNNTLSNLANCFCLWWSDS